MPGKAAKITITERQQEILQTFSRSVTAPSRLRQPPRSLCWPSTAFSMRTSPSGSA